MELRKDPITQSWVRVGQQELPAPSADCPLCSGSVANLAAILELPAGGNPQVRVVSHLYPLYRIEGEAERLPEGIYDRMRPIGAHEIIVESPDHGQSLSRMSDAEIELVLQAYAMRILDLKRDPRFKYVTVFRNQGVLAGQEFDHPSSQVTATMFVPRRILYELRSARKWFELKERCVFCDIVRQEEKQARRVVDNQGDYVAFCPFASRVPFELWLMSRKHNHLFEQPKRGTNRRDLAALLGRCLRRLDAISGAYHLVLHTAPNTITPKSHLTPSYWRTIAEDFHWHIEILPIVEQRSKSYSIKEIYFNALLPEQAAEKLRQIDPQSERLAAQTAAPRMKSNQRGGIIFRLLGLLFFVLFLAVLYLVRHPLLRVAGDFWIVEDPLAHVDAIVVIGDDNFSGVRAARATELFRAGWAPLVVASGRRLRSYAGIAELIARDLESAGVPATAVVLFDHDAVDTHDEAMALRGLAAEKHWRSLLIVTSNYHTRRTRYIFRQLFPSDVSVAVASAKDPSYDPYTWWQRRDSLKMFFLESVAYLVARWELRHGPA